MVLDELELPGWSMLWFNVGHWQEVCKLHNNGMTGLELHRRFTYLE
jgi:hypothetical protein